MRIKIKERLLKYEWIYVNTETVKLMISNYDILLFVLNTFIFDTEEYCLQVKLQVNDARPLKNLYHHRSFIWRFENATGLTGSEITLMCWISFIGKRSTSSQNQTSQIKIRNIQCVLKRLTAGVEQSNCPRFQHLYL